jgi:hypothetical protein
MADFNPDYVPSGPNNKANPYYKAINSVQLAKSDETPSEFLGTVGGGVPIPAPPLNEDLPTVTVSGGGTAYVGSVLFCNKGTWSGYPTPTFAYQWKVNAINVGTNSPNYTPVSGDAGKPCTCTVTATNSEGSAPATSNSVSIVAIPSVPVIAIPPVITGDVSLGTALFSTNGAWTNNPTSYAYQWKRGAGNIAGATTNSYTLAAADVDQAITCVVTATNVGGASAPSASNPITARYAPLNTVPPALSTITPFVGDAITCTSGTWTGSATITYAYQWFADAVTISGAITSSYTPVLGNYQKVLTCRVTASNAYGTPNTLSNPSGPVQQHPSIPVNTVAPFVSGQPQVGSPIESTEGTWEGYPPPTYTHQWQADNVNIPGALETIFTPTEEEVGQQLRCVVTATNSQGSVPANSNETPPIENVAGGATVTWNPDDKSVNITLSNGDRLATKNAAGGWEGVRSTLSYVSGKKYFEIEASVVAANMCLGLGTPNSGFTNYLGLSVEGAAISPNGAFFTGSASGGNGPSYAAGDRLQFAADLTANLIWLRKNGTGLWNNSAGADPDTGVGGLAIVLGLTDEKFIQTNVYDASNSSLICADEAHQLYPAPAGFTAWDISIPVTTTWNPADRTNGLILSNGDLTLSSPNQSWRGIRSIASYSSGKFYLEVTVDVTGTNFRIGINNGTYPLIVIGDFSNLFGFLRGTQVRRTGTQLGTWIASSLVDGDIVGMAVDIDNKQAWARNNNGIWNNNPAADPVANVGGFTFATSEIGPYFASINMYEIDITLTTNFGATPYAGTPPAGFKNWGE